MPRNAIVPSAAGMFAGLLALSAAHAKPEQETRPFSTIGVIRYGMNDSAIGKLMFLSKGQPADRIYAICKMDDLCEVTGTVRGEEIVKVAKAVRVDKFVDPAAPLRWVYSHYKDDKGSFWLEDDDLESLFTPRMAALVVKTRRAAGILEEETAEPSWIGSQDWLIRDLKIDAQEQGTGRAVGTMSYRNMIEQNPKPHTTRFDMVLTDGGWRIDEVRTQPDAGEKPARPLKTGSEVMKEQIAEGEQAKRDKATKANASGSLCRFGEGAIFTCSAKGRQFSICTSGQTHELPHQWIEYRAGTPDKLELVHRSTKVGGPGSFYGAYELYPKGEVSYVRFSRDGYDYTTFSDENSRPQRTGVLVRKDGRSVARIMCSGGQDDAMPKDAAKMPSNMILAVPFDAEQID
jgi:hypothetical protein